MRRAIRLMTFSLAFVCGQVIVASYTASADDSAGPGVATPRSSDFNGDGFSDLVATAGQPEFDEGYDSPGGYVHVVYGSSAGLTPTASQVWTSTDFGERDYGQYFGNGLAVGDFDGDGFSDLAIGSSDDGTGGVVHVLHGSPVGLNDDRRQTWSQDSSGVKGKAEPGNAFGAALVAGDFGSSAHHDLAVGVPGEDAGAGGVNVLYGSVNGLSAVGDQFWSQNTPGIHGRSEPSVESEDDDRYDGGDGFGHELAAGRFTGGAFVDLVVGVPGENLGRIRDAGAVHIIHGSASGLSAQRSQLWTQDTMGIRGRAARSDEFGSSLATGRFAGRGEDDLAVGAPGAYGSDDRRVSGGAVNVIYGSTRGLVTRNNQLWTQESEGIPGRTEGGDLFGVSVAAGNLGRDPAGKTHEDLAIGVPGEVVRDVGVGRVYVLYGAAGGLRADRRQTLTLYGPGTPLEEVNGSSFGAPLAVADFGRNPDAATFADLAVGGRPTAGDDVVVVSHGTSAGLTRSDRQEWLVAEVAHHDGEVGFGSSLAAE